MRAFNRVLSAFLAALLIVAGVLTILEICRAALSQPPAVVQWPKLVPKLRSNSYDDAGPILVCAGLAVVGLLVLISGLRRGKPYALPAGSSAPGVRTEIHRRSLQRAMRTAVLATDRVESVSVTLRRRSARIVAHANTHTIEGLDADIRRRLEGLLGSIALVDPPRLKIKTYAAPAAAAPTSAGTPAGLPPGPAAPPPATEEAAPPPPMSEPAAQQVRAQAMQQPSPSNDPEPAPDRDPDRDPAPDPATDPQSRTTRLDDLLSHPNDGETS